MSLSVLVRQGGGTAAGTADFTDQVPLWRLNDSGPHEPIFTAGMMYGGGQATVTEFKIIDDANEIKNLGTAQVEPHNVVWITEDASGTAFWLQRGRVATSEAGEDDSALGASRTWTVRVEDGNVDLRGLDLEEDWERPEETGTERLIALGSAFLSGDPRVTTNITVDRDHLVVPNPDDGEATMPAFTYETGTPLTDIITDCAETEGQEWGVVLHHEGGSHLCFLWTEEDDWESYPCTLSIDGDGGADNSTSFAPQWDQGAAIFEDGQEVLTGIVSEYGDERQHVVYKDDALVSRYDYWVQKITDATTTTEAGATARAPHLLRGQSKAHVTHTPTLKIPADKTHLIAAGMSIEIRSATSRFEEAIGGTATRRIASVKWEPVAPEVGEVVGQYYAHLELARPLKIARERRRARPGPRAPRSLTQVVRLYHTAHQSGEHDDIPEQLAAPDLALGNIASGWEEDNAAAFEYFMMSPTTTSSVNGAVSWSAVNAAVADVAIRGYVVRLGHVNLTNIIQDGGTVRGQQRANARNGVGINEGAQNHRIESCGRIYRAGSGFVATLWDVGDLTGDTNLAAQATHINRSWGGSFTPYASADADDYLVIDYGVLHTAPTGGGTGAAITFNDSAAEDLPEDESSTAAANSWVEFRSSGDNETTSPTTLPGQSSTGITTGVYAPIDHEHEHGQLSNDGDNLHEASQVDYDNTESGLSAETVQQALDEIASEGVVGLGWFNVKSYGATGDGSTDDTDSINDAIAALNSAGRGILYFPAGNYLIDAGLTAITVPCTIRGDGHTGGGRSLTEFATKITCSDGTATVFDIQSHAVGIEALGFTCSGTPTGGAAIAVTAQGDHGRFRDLYASNFYTGIDIQEGAEWTMSGIHVLAPALYGIKIRHVDLPDGGDWAISDSVIVADARTATAGIQIESSGGGKIVNTKINGDDATNRFTDGIVLAIPTGVTTVDLLVSNCSIENVSRHAFSATTAGTGTFRNIVFNGNQVGFYLGTNNSGKAVSIVGAGTDDFQDIVIGNNVFYGGSGTNRSAIQLTNVNNAILAPNALAGAFTSLYTATTSTNVIEVGASDVDAEDVDVADSGGYYTGTDVEAVLQELGADITSLEAAAAGHYEVIVSGTAPPVAVTNEAEDDWLYGFVPG